MTDRRTEIPDSGPIVRIDATELSRDSLGPLGRLHAWIEGTPIVGKIWLRSVIAVVAVGAGTSLLRAAGQFAFPETTAEIESVVASSWLLLAYLVVFAAAFLSFLAYTLIHTYCVFFQWEFSLWRHRISVAIPRPWTARPVPFYGVSRARLWRHLYELQGGSRRGAGPRFRWRIRRSRIAFALAIALFFAVMAHMNLEAKSEPYRAFLGAWPWAGSLIVFGIAAGFVGLAEFFRLRRHEAQSASARRRAWTFRAGAVGLLALPIVFNWAGGGPILGGDNFDALPEAIRVIAGMVVVFGWFGGVGFLFYRAHTAMDANVTDVRSSDERAAVVLFRSFHDDNLLIPRLWSSARGDFEDPAVAAKYLQSESLVSFEEVIERQVRDYAPLIAVGRPGVIRRGGAIREHFSDDRWQRAVAEWMGAARYIVVIASSTPGLRWELTQIIRRGQLDRLIVVVPPGRRRAERWRAMAESFVGTPWFERFSLEDPTDVLALHWAGDERVHFLCGESKCDRDYEIALHLVVYGLSMAADA